MKAKFQQVCILLLSLVVPFNCQDFTTEPFGNAQFHVFLSPLLTDEAIAQCESIDSTLASVRSQLEFDFLEAFFSTNGISELLQLGLIRDAATDGTDPLSFDFIDGSQDKAFIQNREVLPWSPNEPSGNNQEQCVLWHIPGSANIDPNRWDDFQCNIVALPFLCRSVVVNEGNEEIILMISIACAIAAFLVTLILIRVFKKKTARFRKSKLFIQEKQKEKKFKPLQHNYILPTDQQSTFNDNSTVNTRTTMSESGYTELHAPIQSYYPGYHNTSLSLPPPSEASVEF